MKAIAVAVILIVGSGLAFVGAGYAGAKLGAAVDLLWTALLLAGAAVFRGRGGSIR